MIKLLEFMRKHKICTLIISVLIFTVPLIIVNQLYKMDCKIPWLQSEWSAGDILEYIAGFEAFFGTVALGFLALWQNHQIQAQHIESQEPLLSMSLINENHMLYLVIENTGATEAKEINIDVSGIYNNGQENKLDLDGLFNTIFELYPKEKVKGRVAYSGENTVTEIYPQIELKVSYVRPDLNRKKEYKRTVSYYDGSTQRTGKNTHEKRIESDIDKIAKANVRIANYLDGHQIAKFDEINILANRSLQNDLVEAITAKKKIPIYDRAQVIEGNIKNRPQDE